MLSHDLRHAARAVRRAPGFAAVAIGTLAAGIGATVAMFSVVQGVLLAPLPYREPDRIVAVTTRLAAGRETPRIAGADFVDVRASGVFAATAYYYGGEVGVQMAGRADFVHVFWTTADFFPVFGIAPAVGRPFGDDETDTAAVVAGDFAARHFGGAATALGAVVSVENRSYRIVGVLPSGFAFPSGAEIWLPAGATPRHLDRTAFRYRAVARLTDGTSLDRAQRVLDQIAARISRDDGTSDPARRFEAAPLRDELVAGVRPTLRLLFGAVVLVLLIACANVANLQLARAVTRARELAVRVALGAGRLALLRQVVAESLLLWLGGGLGGIALAASGTRLLLRMAPVDLPRLDDVHVDWTVLGFAGVVSFVASLGVAIVPLWPALATDPRTALQRGSGRALGGSGLDRTRGMLVMGEIGLAFVLVVAAGLLLRSLVALSAVPLGYRTERMLVMYAHAPAATEAEYLGVGRQLAAILDDLRVLPGVTSAAAVMGLPGGRYGSSGGYAVEGRQPFAPGQQLPQTDFALASPGYFETMGMRLLRGRDFQAADRYDTPFVAVVSEALARESFPGVDPIGRRVQCSLDSTTPMTIVGVVSDVRAHSPARAPQPLLYMPLTQHPYFANEVQVVVGSAVAPESLENAVRHAVESRNPLIATKFTTVARTLEDSVAAQRFRAALLVSFGALAILLACAGVYGVMSYVAAQRTAEFGVRLALGAQPRDVVGLVLRRAGLLAAGGLALGAGAASALTGIVASLLFGVAPHDAVSFAAALAILAVITLLAAAVPAWRASRVDPVVALRAE